MRVGRYQDALLANQRATQVDETYITQCHMQGVYPIGYVPHNHHFLWAAASMQGQRELAVRAAASTDAHTAHEMQRDPGMGTLQHYALTPLYTYTRFGMWDQILKSPAPAADLLYPTGVWHYARGLAFARTQRLPAARRELVKLAAIAARDTLAFITIWEINTTKQVLDVAQATLEGEIASSAGDHDTAIAALQRAVQLEDALNYNEPADWYFPVRHVLGAVLLAAGRPAEAEAVYAQDLVHYPENGWSLFGMAQSLAAQNRMKDEAAVRRRFEKAWVHADVQLTASRF